VKALNIGMPVEVAVWLTGRETGAQIERWRRDVAAELGRFELENGVLLGERVWTEKRPGEDRVPKVPAHISGPNVRLWVCEACVAAPARPVIEKATGFVHDLDKRDLERLRALTREAHAAAWPTAPILTDAECDEVIERVGPGVALKRLYDGVNAGAFH